LLFMSFNPLVYPFATPPRGWPIVIP